jgi:hypothetical protein
VACQLSVDQTAVRVLVTVAQDQRVALPLFPPCIPRHPYILRLLGLRHLLQLVKAQIVRPRGRRLERGECSDYEHVY